MNYYNTTPSFERVMFRSKINNSNIDNKFTSVGQNTGNLVFTKALEEELNLNILPIEECYEKKPKYVVTTDLIWITPHSDFSYLIKQIETFKDSVFVPLGVGIQANNCSEDFKLNNSVLKVLNLVQERAILACRGEYTASILEKNNIKNIEVVGCPSVYLKGSKGYNIDNKKVKGKNVLCNFKAFCNVLSKDEKHFLSYCASNNYDFIEQNKHCFSLYLSSGDNNYFKFVSDWLSKRSHLFFDVDEWNSFVSGYDFSMGARFHGNIVAIWNNIPALFIPIDSRTQEMIDFFKFPYIKFDEFDSNKPIDYYIEKADYTEFNKKYYENYNKYEEILIKNGLLDLLSLQKENYYLRKENEEQAKEIKRLKETNEFLEDVSSYFAASRLKLKNANRPVN